MKRRYFPLIHFPLFFSSLLLILFIAFDGRYAMRIFQYDMFVDCGTLPAPPPHLQDFPDKKSYIFAVMVHAVTDCPSELVPTCILDAPLFLWSASDNPWSTPEVMKQEQACHYEGLKNQFDTYNICWKEARWDKLPIKWPREVFPNLTFINADSLAESYGLPSSHGTLDFTWRLPDPQVLEGKSYMTFTYPIFSEEGQEMWFYANLYLPNETLERKEKVNVARAYTRSRMYIQLTWDGKSWILKRKKIENPCGITAITYH